MQRRPQLIAYADRLAGDIDGVRSLLEGALDGCFAGVHLLPFFDPIDGTDAGFDPVDHTVVDRRLGDWDAIGRLGQGLSVMADVIVNHVSSRSPAFLDWLARGDASPFDGMFLTLDAVFPDGAHEAGLTAIYRPRPGLPLTPYVGAGGTTRLMWTTFTSEQIDIDVVHVEGWAYLMRILDRLAAARVAAIRLDAVGYAVKRAGTSCFMIPETFDFIGRLATEAQHRRMEVLVEIHGDHRTQIGVARSVDWVYDFALPPLVIDALTTADSGPLERWLEIRPGNAVTVLDTHDGIGVVDVAGLLADDRIDALVEGIHERSGGESRLATGAAASNLDLYQVNCTFYSAFGCDDQRYLAARLIQLLVPGVPQIYYVGLLAGRNDMDLLGATGVGRDINRHRYTSDEVERELERSVVRRLLDLLRWRTRHPAFDGTFEVRPSDQHLLSVAWRNGADSIDAVVDLRSATFVVDST